MNVATKYREILVSVSGPDGGFEFVLETWPAVPRVGETIAYRDGEKLWHAIVNYVSWDADNYDEACVFLSAGPAEMAE